MILFSKYRAQPYTGIFICIYGYLILYPNMALVEMSK